MAFPIVKLYGTESIIDLFNRLSTGQFMTGVAAAVQDEASKIMEKSKQIVPLEDGILRGSATIQPVQISGQTFTIDMGYGGAASAYALVQHENMSYHHPGLHSHRKGQTGRSAKYLEKPMREGLNGIEQRLIKAVERYFAAAGI
jgi:hypothetical protein